MTGDNQSMSSLVPDVTQVAAAMRGLGTRNVDIPYLVSSSRLFMTLMSTQKRCTRMDE